MNRKQFWMRWIGLTVALMVIDAILKNTENSAAAIDTLILGIAYCVGAVYSVRVLYLRAVDVGYVKAGWMTACTMIPLIGIGVFLTIAFLPTGSRTGCTLPCWPSTQKRWAQSRLVPAE